jgi:antitoxin (DNA-binding transcriptional repressor) of toxin-antitoxin stability system
MGGRKSTQNRAETTTDGQRVARLVPAQQRSRERFERILACAVEVTSKEGFPFDNERQIRTCSNLATRPIGRAAPR